MKPNLKICRKCPDCESETVESGMCGGDDDYCAKSDEINGMIYCLLNSFDFDNDSVEEIGHNEFVIPENCPYLLEHTVTTQDQKHAD